MTDPIVDEVRAIRAKIAEDCGYDLKRIIENSHETARRVPGSRYVSKEDLVRRAERRVADTGATEVRCLSRENRE
jgi:hypothetical protein